MVAPDRAERRRLRVLGEIGAASAAFEGRWTMGALRKADLELAARLERQITLWVQADESGDDDAIELQGGALARGYQAAYRIMQEKGVGDDAYLVGRAGDLTIAIGDPVAVEARAKEVDASVVWFTPDEIASLLASLGGFKTVADIKRAFPGSTVK